MKIFIAGAGGFIGSKATKFFLSKGYEVTALDRFYFGNTLSSVENHENLRVIKDDIRYFDPSVLKGIDCVINLAAISNDPAGELNPKLTQEINHKAAIRLGEESKKAGIQKHIFVSSCSVYGTGEGILTEESSLAPVSEYAKSKIKAEKDLKKLVDKDFSITFLRLATLFGVSLRMRFDLIVNIMTLHAWEKGKIYVLGGGKQWRPLIHVDDVIKCFELILKEKDISKLNGEVYNVGSNDLNFQVEQVAIRYKRFFPSVSIEVTPDDPDPRSYRVNFDKIRGKLGFDTSMKLDDGIQELKESLELGKSSYNLSTSTVKYYKYLIEADKKLSEVKLNNNLF